MEYDDEKKEKLNKLENKLYSRNNPNIINSERTDLKDVSPVSTTGLGKANWQEVKNAKFDELAAKVSHMAQKKHNFVNKVFIASLVIFVLALVSAAFVFLGGGNLVSSRNVDISVFGSVSVPSGQEVFFDVNIANNNNINLESASLLIEYPEGVRSPLDLSKELVRDRFDIGTIKSGESYRQNVRVVFFGEKEDIKEIKMSLEYRVKDSSALFYKEKVHEVSISSSPVIITPVYPKEVNSNQEIYFEIEVASNSKDRIEDFLVTVEYPFGFVFKSATPKPSFGEDVWQFTSLNSGEKKKITFVGNIIGQNNEEKIFNIKTGTVSENDERVISIPFSELAETILVKKPFIGLDTTINDQAENAVIRGGEEVTTDLSVRNNLPSRLFNVSVEAELKGSIFDKLSVSPTRGGFFESSTNKIIWDKRSVSDFSDMDPGSNTALSFDFSSLPYSSIPKGENPEIEILIKVRGERVLESGSVEQVLVTQTQKAVLGTNVSVSSNSYRSVGNIENTGPIPPRVDVPTTYTILWSVNNSFNQVSNVEVKAVLPLYVKWKELHTPSSEKVSFNEVTNEVVWNVGSVLPDTGFGSSKREVYFQLEFLPSSSQLGETPIILKEANLVGIDKVTGLRVEYKSPVVTTSFSKDPSFKMGNEKVIQ